MKFSYSEVWNDTVELLRSNSTIIMAIAGVFLFLPALVTAYFLTPPVPKTLGEMLPMWVEYFTANWHWLLLERLFEMVGAISLLLLFLDARGRSVGALISGAVMILPFYFLATLLSSVLLAIGLALFLVPGLYLLSRLAFVGPDVAVAGTRNPFVAITRSFAQTKGNGWAILGLLMLIAIPGTIIAGTAGMLLGLLFLAIAGQDVGAFLTQIVQALAGAVLGVVILAVIAALYRRLAGASAAARAN